MEPTYLILLILAVIYLPLYAWVWRSPNAYTYGPRRYGRLAKITMKLGPRYFRLCDWIRKWPNANDYNLYKYGPCIMIKTRSGIRLMERGGKYRRFWRAFGIFSIAVSFVLMAFIIYILVVGLLNLPTSINSSGLGIEYALAIPGINPLLSGEFFVYAIIGLIVAMVIHELAHGFQTKANGMKVDSTGVLYGVVPLGAFVDPNEDDIEKSTRRAKLDLYSAGIATNFIGAAVAFFIFAVLMLGGISSDFGDNTGVNRITDNSPALEAGIPAGAIILYVDDEEYAYNNDYTVTHSWDPGDPVTITYLTEDGERTADIRWGLLIERVTNNSPASESGLSAGTFLLSIDGTPIYGYSEFISFMRTTAPGTTVTIESMDRNGTALDPISLTFDDNGSGIGFVGITTSTSGMSFITPNIMLDIGRNPIYGSEGIVDMGKSMISYITGPLSGFSPLPSGVHWWYDTPLGDAFWIIVSILYWIFWLNIMLGVSNAIPAIPFDGGFIFHGSFNALLERLGMKNEKKREETATSVTVTLSWAMIFMLIIVIAVAVIPR